MQRSESNLGDEVLRGAKAASKMFNIMKKTIPHQRIVFQWYCKKKSNDQVKERRDDMCLHTVTRKKKTIKTVKYIKEGNFINETKRIPTTKWSAEKPTLTTLLHILVCGY